MASLRQFPHGRWQAVVRRQGHPPQLKTFATRQDAKRWATQVENEVDRCIFVDRVPSEAVLIGELID